MSVSIVSLLYYFAALVPMRIRFRPGEGLSKLVPERCGLFYDANGSSLAFSLISLFVLFVSPLNQSKSI